jgi:hypothetical protein
MWLFRGRRIERKIDVILRILDTFSHRLEGIRMTLVELEAQVAQNTAVEASAVLLIQGIAAQLAAVATDPAKVQALADSLKTSADSLAAAVVANTPAV